MRPIRPNSLADVLAWLDQPARAASVQQRFLELHHQLKQDTASRRQ